MAATIAKGQTWKPKRGICVAIIDEVLSEHYVRVIKRGEGFKDRSVDLLVSSLRRDYELDGAP